MPRVLAAGGCATTLITDNPAVLDFPAAADFDDVVQLADATTERAADASESSLARLFAAVSGIVESRRRPRLVWVHSRGMYGPWDAPRELQQSLLDEGDPPPVEETEPPDFLLPESADPDINFRYATAYAAQVMVLDSCWQGLSEMLDASDGNSSWLVILLGVRGFPLGQQRRIGGGDERLYADTLHVPMLMRFPDGTGRLARSHQLASHLDLLPTLLDWTAPADAPADGPAAAPHDGLSLLKLATDARDAWRDALVFANARGDRAIRTLAWSLLQSSQAGAGSRESDLGTPGSPLPPPCSLYVRPDDRWEANDVAGLCPEIVDGLASALDDVAGKLARGEAIADETLPEDLKTPIR